MREIKFRFYDPQENQMCSSGLEVDLGGNLAVFMGENECPIMQYTGLKDKNGKEIYEGDVVRVADIYNQINFGGERTYETLPVKWGDFGWLPFIFPGGIDCEFMYSDTDCEVIGNIYENPELLTPTNT